MQSHGPYSAAVDNSVLHQHHPYSLRSHTAPSVMSMVPSPPSSCPSSTTASSKYVCNATQTHSFLQLTTFSNGPLVQDMRSYWKVSQKPLVFFMSLTIQPSAPTAAVQKQDDSPLTYLNKGTIERSEKSKGLDLTMGCHLARSILQRYAQGHGRVRRRYPKHGHHYVSRWVASQSGPELLEILAKSAKGPLHCARCRYWYERPLIRWVLVQLTFLLKTWVVRTAYTVSNADISIELRSIGTAEWAPILASGSTAYRPISLVLKVSRVFLCVCIWKAWYRPSPSRPRSRTAESSCSGTR